MTFAYNINRRGFFQPPSRQPYCFQRKTDQIQMLHLHLSQKKSFLILQSVLPSIAFQDNLVIPPYYQLDDKSIGRQIAQGRWHIATVAMMILEVIPKQKEFSR